MTYTPRLRKFLGRSIYGTTAPEVMPRLVSGKSDGRAVDGTRRLITAGEVLHFRIHGNKWERSLLRNYSILTGDVAIADPEESGEAIIALQSNPLVRKMVDLLCSDTLLEGGSLPVDTDFYHVVRDNSLVLDADVAEALRNNAYDGQAAREEIWEYLSRGDRDTVKDNMELVLEAAGRDVSNSMGLFLESIPAEDGNVAIPGLRLISLYSICSGSDAGAYAFSPAVGKVVGVALEQSCDSLESKIEDSA